MRIFSDFPEAFNEIRRDLKEMGLPVETQTMQDKLIQPGDNLDTVELMNYIYTVTNPDIADLKPTRPWVENEWHERRSGIYGDSINPGIAWRSRADTWEEFLHNGEFSYTYADRFSSYKQVLSIIRRLKEDKFSRQLYISMWASADSAKLGVERVPCSLGWHFLYRGGQLHMTYFMRSCDFATHFQNDVYLSMKLLMHVALACDLPMGRFTQFMSSLHVYTRDVEDVF